MRIEIETEYDGREPSRWRSFIVMRHENGEVLRMATGGLCASRDGAINVAIHILRDAQRRGKRMASEK